MAEIYQSMVSGDSALFKLALEGKARRYALANLFILGILFGISNLIGALQTTPNLPMDGKYAFITPLIFSTAGVVTMSGALIAFTMVYWAAAKAFGGYGGFGLIFDLIGLAVLPFWFLAPMLNYALRYPHDGILRIVLVPAIVGVFVWSFMVVRQSLVTGQGISMTRANIAVAAMWIFSISSVYVFVP